MGRFSRPRGFLSLVVAVAAVAAVVAKKGVEKKKEGAKMKVRFLLPLHRPRFPPTPLPFIHSFAC